MEYQALYRQFRPETFDDVVGQEHIVRALSNQIESGKIAHAYLFCGTRGTGKTTTARILSRAVNCECRTGANPCNRCASCQSIIDGSAIDVTEIDAASNTSVDNIRDIRDEVIYPPVMLKYKVYIIDEVHMLSIGAFNALLKTLEEPPEHVIFILATTEYHKVPATILSRCQRFDFHRIDSNKISQRIKFVCDESGYNIDDKACSTITYAADGSMRDALAILDKCASYGNNEIEGSLVEKILGIVDDNTIFNIVNAIAKKDAGSLIELTELAIREGRDPVLLTSYLIEHFRCLLVAMLSKDISEVLQMSFERANMFKEQSSLFTVKALSEIVNTLCNTYKMQKESPNPKVILEIGLVSLCDSSYSEPKKTVVVPEITVPQPKTIIKETIPETKPQQKVDKIIIKTVEFNWENVLKEIASMHKMRLFSELMQAQISLSEDVLSISLPSSHLAQKDYIDNNENKKAICDAVKNVSGKDMQIKILFSDEDISNKETGNILNLADKFPDIVSIDESEENSNG